MKYSVKREQNELAYSAERGNQRSLAEGKSNACPKGKKKAISLSAVFALFVVFAVIVLASCEKPLISDEYESGDTKGNLRVSVFQIEKTPFTSLTRSLDAVTRAGQTASAVCTRLNIAIYDMAGTRVKQVNQTSDMADFGHASFHLPEGDYILVVVGHSSGGNPTMTDPTCIKFANSQGYTDTFLCCGTVTIAEEQVDLQVTLDRIASRCSFVLTDETYPSDVKKMRFYYTGGSGAFDATTGLGCVNSKQDVKFEVTADKKQFDLYTFLHDMEGIVHLTVTALDNADNVLYERTFDVPMQQNHITWLSGEFFNGSGSSSTTTITGITVNTDWAGETHLTF